MMGEAEIAGALEIADQLRERLGVASTTPSPIEPLILAAYAEGFRRGWWDRDEYDQLQEDN